ncbi:hypothetical protein D3C75_1269520 [compost metagenome]
MKAKPTSNTGETVSLNTNMLRTNIIVGPMYCTNPSVDSDMRAAARAKNSSGNAVTTPESNNSKNIGAGNVQAVVLPTMPR